MREKRYININEIDMKKVEECFIELCYIVGDKSYDHWLESGERKNLGKLDLFRFLIMHVDENKAVFEALLINNLFTDIHFILGRNGKKWKQFLDLFDPVTSPLNHKVIMTMVLFK